MRLAVWLSLKDCTSYFTGMSQCKIDKWISELKKNRIGDEIVIRKFRSKTINNIDKTVYNRNKTVYNRNKTICK